MCPVMIPNDRYIKPESLTAKMKKDSAWDDVRSKAQDIRSSGGVRIIAVTDSEESSSHGHTYRYITAEISSTSGKTYESMVEFVPATKELAAWRCECDWATYRDPSMPSFHQPSAHLSGRKCSHLEALWQEVLSRGMFGKEVREDVVAAKLGEISKESVWRRAGFYAKYQSRILFVKSLSFEHGLADLDQVGEVPLTELYHPAYDPVLGLQVSRSASRKNATEAHMSKHEGVKGGDHDGMMIAFDLPEEVKQAIQEDGGESIDQMHLTLAYLGKAADFADRTDAIHDAVADWVARWQPFEAGIAGFGVWDIEDGKVLWASVDAPKLSEARTDLVHTLAEFGVEFEENHDWTAHTTLRYLDTGDQVGMPGAVPEVAKTFILDTVRVVFGDMSDGQTFTLGDPIQAAAVQIRIRSRKPKTAAIDFDFLPTSKGGGFQQSPDGFPASSVAAIRKNPDFSPRLKSRDSSGLQDEGGWQNLERVASISVQAAKGDSVLHQTFSDLTEAETHAQGLSVNGYEVSIIGPEGAKSLPKVGAIAPGDPSLAHIEHDPRNPRSKGEAGNADIAAEARKVLAELSPEEAQAILEEGESDGVMARNIGELSLEGTHYEALEAILSKQDAEVDQASPEDLFF
jgi:2'-5' RNA ligase